MADIEGPGTGLGTARGTTMQQPQDNESTTASTPARKGRVRSTWPLYVVFAVVAGTVAMVISLGFVSENLAALGLPDPGVFTTAGLPFFRAAGWIFATMAVGSFMFSAFLISPKVPGNDNVMLRSAPLNVDGHLASRTGSVSAMCFGLIGILMIPLVLSDTSGQPFSAALQPSAWSAALDQVATAVAWLWVAIVSLITGVAGMFTKKWITQPLLFLGAIAAIIPLGLEGHSASGGSHDYGTNSFLWHLLFLVLWVGGLIALIAHGRRLGPDLDIAVERYSKLALIAVIAMAASGLVNAAIRIEWSDWFTSSYGLLVVAKTVGVVVLGFFGFVHRQLTIPQIRRNPHRHGLFRRVAVVEVLVMAAITGVAVSMGRTPPPAPDNPNLSTMAIRLGYDLWKEPTFFNVWTMWRFDIMFSVIGILLAAAYIWGVVKVHRKGGTWEKGRTAWFLLGCATLAVIMSSGVGMNMMAMFSVHMIGHMILSMVIPVFWVLGAPFSLILKAVDPGEPGKPGLHEWVQVAVDNPVLKFLMHPAFNTIQFLVIFYLLYLTPLFDILIYEHAGHLGMNFVFLLSGYLYFWEMIGPDPKPEERSTVSRLGWLVFSMPFHLFFGVYLMQLNHVLGEDFYSVLNLPWDPDLLADQKAGGGIAWAATSFPLIIVFGVLFNNWRKEDRELEKKIDKKAEEDDYDDLDAYNAMLARINELDGNPQASYHRREFGGDSGDRSGGDGTAPGGSGREPEESSPGHGNGPREK